MPDNATHDELVTELEAVYAHVQNAAQTAPTAQSSGILNSLRLMLAPSVEAAQLLRQPPQ
jgi:hypothetical protein